MEQRNDNELEIDLTELILVLLHKLWIIIIVGILGAVIAGAYSYFMLVPIYASTAKIYVINRQIDDVTTWSDLQSGTYLARDFMILVKSRPVTEEVIKKLNLDMTHEQLSAMISVTTPPDTRVLEIMVSHPDPHMAKQLTDAIAQVSSDRLVSVMEMKKVNIIEHGNTPQYPTSPNLMRNTVIGGMLGAIIASFLIVLIYTLNDSIRTSEDIERRLGMTTLGIIPIEDGKFNKKRKKMRRRKEALLMN